MRELFRSNKKKTSVFQNQLIKNDQQMCFLSRMTSVGDDISGSGSGMCVGSHCPRNRPGLYAYPPDNNRVTGASMCRGRLCSLLLLLPLVVLLLQRWWTTATSHTGRSGAGPNHGKDNSRLCWAGQLEHIFAKKLKTFKRMTWTTFSLTKRSKRRTSDNILYFDVLICHSLSASQFLDSLGSRCENKGKQRDKDQTTRRRKERNDEC